MHDVSRQDNSEERQATVSVVMWNVRFDRDIDKILPSDLVDTLDIIQFNNFADLSYYLQIRPDVRLVLTCLDPDDLQNLCDIQRLQQEHPDVALMAVMEECVRISAFVDLLRRYAAQEIGTDGADTGIYYEAAAGDAVEVQRPNEICQLTARQRDVLGLLMWGKTNKQIARALNLSEGTVKIHCLAIFRELGVTNRTQAALRAEKLLPQLREHWDAKLRVHH